MPTIIDSFITEFRADPVPFEEGSERVREALEKTREEVAGGADDFDTYGKRASEFFGKLRNEAVGLFLAFQGASSIKGFITDIIASDAATGRLARNLGIATEELSAWQLAIKTVGGSAEEANAALSAIEKAYQTFALTGELPNQADYLGLGISLEDFKKGPDEVLLKMAEAAERMDQTEFYARMQRIGIPDSVINQLVKGREATEKLIEEKKKEGAATDEQAKAAAEFEKKLADLSAKITGLVRPALYGLVELLLDFLTLLEENNIELPVLIGFIGAIAFAAAAAASPFLAWAAAITAVVAALGALYAARENIMDSLGLGDDKIGGGYNAPGSGGVGAGVGAGVSAGPAPSGKSPGANEAYIRNYLRASGLTEEQTRGVMAGIFAESGMNPNAKNPTSGAYGIGQWLGPRKRALMAKYGPNPTLEQQLAFLVQELKGGDWGGKSVMRSTTAEDTLSNYIGGPGWGFMRPDPAGRAGDMRRGYNYLGRGPSRPAATGARASRPAGGGAGASVHIGQITVNTAATDAAGIARDLPAAIRRRGVIAQANTGLA